MNSGNPLQPGSNPDRSPELEIYLHARNVNLLWRYEILVHNKLDPTKLIKQMEDDIFWDLAEIDREHLVTKSLRMTGLGIVQLPDKLSVPFSSQVLDLSRNGIDKIPIDWFQHMRRLSILRIADNDFRDLQWEGISLLENLKILDLRGNPWNEDFVDKFNSYVKVFAPNIQKVYW